TLQAISLADWFNAEVGDRRVSGYKVKLAAPEGPSTGGGMQALQHISLIPDAGGATITAGSANQVTKVAELRSHQYPEQRHRQRCGGKSFPLDRVSYNELLKRMQAFFTKQRLAIVLLDSSPAAGRPQSRAGVMLLGVLIAVFTAGAVYFFLGK